MSWTRIEGSTRDPDVAEGLAANVADPLWLLARQWQVGEFHGEDAASPVMVTSRVSVTPITAFASGDATTRLGRLDDRPVEVLVEQEPVDDDIRLTLELGWTLLRSLATDDDTKEVRQRLRERYAPRLPDDDGLDPAGRAAVELLARRSLDGLALARDVRESGGLRDFLRTVAPAGEVRGLVGTFRAWLATVSDFVRVPDEEASAWRAADLEYRFRVAAPLTEGQVGPIELGLTASEYAGGHLDWYHFRRDPKLPPMDAPGRPAARDLTVLPTALRFSGMPASRFWEIEDHAVSFGDLVGGEEDIARSVVGAFAAVYGDNWWKIPCRVPVGSVARVERLTIVDDYGQEHDIESVAANDGPDRVWRFFELEGDPGPDATDPTERVAPLLLVAPTLADVDQGRPVERVDFRRDEIANLVWGIERRALGSAGRSVHRAALATPPPDDPPIDDQWSFDAFRPVPEHWVPFVPTIDESQGAASAQTYLRRGRMAATVPDVPAERLVPMGRVLDASRPLRIHEEAIPDAGLRIERRYQRTRGSDGRVHLWMGRRVRHGARRQRGKVLNDVLRRPGNERA